MIKIAFIIDTIESPTAGTEKQLLMLIKHLDRTKFQPYLCVLRKSEWLEQEYKESELIEIGVPSFVNPVSYLNIAKFIHILKKLKIDIVQTHFVEGNKVGTIAAKLAGIKTIIGTRRNQGYWHNKLEILLLGVLNRSVSYFLANSENTRQWAVKTEGIQPNRIHVIHNSLETELYLKGSDIECSSFRETLNFPCKATVIGIVANLRPVKAIDVFIRAAKMVSEKCPTARFIVIGEGPEREMLEQLCAELGIDSLVIFMGRRLDISKILGCIDIGILSSNSESFSNAIVEYMAASLPVVCTDVGGAKEAVENNVNGYVVPSRDHKAMAERIVSIINSENMALFGQNSRDKAERLFSLPAIMKKYEQFYERVIKT